VFSQVSLPEIMLVLAIALIVLGPKRLPSAARSLGKGIREFKSSLTDADPRSALHEDDEDEAPKPALAKTTAEAPKPARAKTTAE
jgi:TatA/E family protein of Tat protein translocase